MNKNDLIDQIAGKTGLTKAATSEAIEALLETISTTLEKGEEVRLTGFGSFRMTERKASEGRNPRTGEVIQIQPSKNIKFRVGTELKERVNKRRSAG